MTPKKIAKTLAAWAVVILIIFGVCRGFAKDPSSAPSLPRVAGYVAAAVLGFLGLLFLGSIGVALQARRRANQLFTEGEKLWSGWNHDAARAAFTEGEKLEPTWPSWGFYLGQLELLRWRVPEARAHFDRSWQLVLARQGSRVATRQKFHTMKAVLPQWIALCAAIAGDPRTALEWIAKAGDVLANHPATLARASLACRAGDFVTAAKELGGFDADSTGEALGVLAVTLTAWTREQTTGEPQKLEPTMFVGGPPPQLGQAWPELAAFVARASVT